MKLCLTLWLYYKSVLFHCNEILVQLILYYIERPEILRNPSNLNLKQGGAKTYFGPTALKRTRAMARVAHPRPTPMDQLWEGATTTLALRDSSSDQDTNTEFLILKWFHAISRSGYCRTSLYRSRDVASLSRDARTRCPVAAHKSRACHVMWSRELGARVSMTWKHAPDNFPWESFTKQCRLTEVSRNKIDTLVQWNVRNRGILPECLSLYLISLLNPANLRQNPGRIYNDLMVVLIIGYLTWQSWKFIKFTHTEL